jgi:hypothetical protein
MFSNTFNPPLFLLNQCITFFTRNKKNILLAPKNIRNDYLKKKII